MCRLKLFYLVLYLVTLLAYCVGVHELTMLWCRWVRIDAHTFLCLHLNILSIISLVIFYSTYYARDGSTGIKLRWVVKCFALFMNCCNVTCEICMVTCYKLFHW